MAIIYQNPNGKISGRLGPIYAKIVKGRNIFAIMPIPTGRLYDALSNAYDKFRVASKFASALSHWPSFKSLNESLRGRFYSGFHAILSGNVKLVGLTAPTEYNKIVVDGFGFTASNINVTETAVTATIPALNTQMDPPAEASAATFLGVVCYSDPVEPEKYPPFIMTKIEKEVPSFNFAASYSFTQNLSPYQLSLGTQYQRKTVYLAVTIDDDAGHILLNSATAAAVL
ncbi:MAG: hypothetical protein AB9882_04010 [Ignavibacteriaceae bacterium]